MWPNLSSLLQPPRMREREAVTMLQSKCISRHWRSSRTGTKGCGTWNLAV